MGRFSDVFRGYKFYPLPKVSCNPQREGNQNGTRMELCYLCEIVGSSFVLIKSGKTKVGLCIFSSLLNFES